MACVIFIAGRCVHTKSRKEQGQIFLKYEGKHWDTEPPVLDDTFIFEFSYKGRMYWYVELSFKFMSFKLTIASKLFEKFFFKTWDGRAWAMILGNKKMNKKGIDSFLHYVPF